MSEKKLLHDLARLYNVQVTYYDIFGRLIEPPPDAILRVLRILGAPVERTGDLADALRHRHQALWQRSLDPVVIAWDGELLGLKLRLPCQLAEATAKYQITLENGETLQGECQDTIGITPSVRRVEGIAYVTRRLNLNKKLPLGYHRLNLQVSDLLLDSYLFSSPLKNLDGATARAKQWGIFCPLYALNSEKSWGAGDFSDLELLVAFAGQMGAEIVGTLPLLAAFLDEPFNPSPYSPVSRLFWNEFYLDIARIPEVHSCPRALALIRSSSFQSELKNAGTAPLIEYRRLMSLKRKVLEEMAHSLLGQPSERRSDFESYVTTHPRAQDYAEFRAKVERERKPWQLWSEANREGTLRAGEYEENIKHYHLYVQWQADEQMRAVGEKAKSAGAGLYLDFPLGVNRDGYDVWRERAAFARGASGGAPPDDFFTRGQNWGFPPLHPEGLRHQGYRYYIHCVRHHLQYARMLRIDHVMGLHHFYWVPDGFAPTEGVYVRNPAEEFYAILNLEAYRYRAQIVGENLGTVPPYVNVAMAKHQIHGMYVGQFSINSDSENPVQRVPERTVASVNTHDTPTFAGFWNGEDIFDRLALGLLSPPEVEEHQRERASRRANLIGYLRSHGWLDDSAPDPAAVITAWLNDLASGNASLLLVNLEDLWLEPLPQNVPGTWQERPNWKRKTRFSLETIRQMPAVVDTLKAINDKRKLGR